MGLVSSPILLDSYRDTAEPTPRWTCPISFLSRTVFMNYWNRTQVPLNVAIIYFLAAMAQELPTTAIGLLLTQTMQVEPEAVVQYYMWSFFPWSFKPLYALLVDNVTIGGLRRRPYLWMSLTLASIAGIVQAYCSLHHDYPFVLATSILLSICFCLVEVVLDATVIEIVAKNDARTQAILRRDASLHDNDDGSRAKTSIEAKAIVVVGVGVGGMGEEEAVLDTDANVAFVPSSYAPTVSLLNGPPPLHNGPSHNGKGLHHQRATSTTTIEEGVSTKQVSLAQAQSVCLFVRTCGSVTAALLSMAGLSLLSPAAVLGYTQLAPALALLAVQFVAEASEERGGREKYKDKRKERGNTRSFGLDSCCDCSIGHEPSSKDSDKDSRCSNRPTSSCTTGGSQNLSSSLLSAAHEVEICEQRVKAGDKELDGTILPTSASAPPPLPPPRPSSSMRLYDKMLLLFTRVYFFVKTTWSALFLVFVINAVPSAMDAFSSYVYDVFTFPPWQYALQKFSGLLGMLLGAGLYGRYLSTTRLTVAFAIAFACSLLIAAFHLLLVTGASQSVLHLPPLTYVPIATFIIGLLSVWLAMPAIVLASVLCQEGSEALIFSIFSSVGHVGTLASSAISAKVVHQLGIRLKHWDALWQLIVLCAGLKVAWLLLLPWMRLSTVLPPLPTKTTKLFTSSTHRASTL